MFEAANTSHDGSASGQLALLSRVAYDDLFRAELEARPREVLSQLGLSLDPEQIPERVKLPSKDVLVSFLDEKESEIWSMRDRDPHSLSWRGFLG